MKNTYWNNKGRYQEDFDRMSNDLMPAMGAADTVAGELIRSANRIAYDFYNNGFCNNTTGAAKFLMEFNAIDPGIFNKLMGYANHGMYNGNYDGDNIQIAVESMIDSTVKFIKENPLLLDMKNYLDMLDFSDEDEYDNDEDYGYDDDDDGYWSY